MNANPVHLERLYRVTPEQRAELEAFAQSFGHTFPETFPIDLAYVHGELKGYYQVTEHAVIYPALHPGKTSPRDFYRLFTHLMGAYRQRYGNPWMVTDAAYTEGGPTPELFGKLGIRPLEKTVYEIAP